MKTMMIPALLGALLIMTGCDTKLQTDRSVDSVGVDRVAEIAGDKTATAEMMRLSFAKGTFDDALALAMQDSALAYEVLTVVRADPRFLAELSAKVGATTSKARTSTPSTQTTSQRKQGDVLDQTEEKARQTNEKLDQAARIKKQAEEAKRKAEEIFKP